jgi:hypothetical protein
MGERLALDERLAPPERFQDRPMSMLPASEPTSHALPSPAGSSVADLLRRLADEFRDLSDLSESLQDLPGRLGNLDSTGIVAAQQIDSLTQRLQGLAAFSTALATTVPAGWRLDSEPAAALVTLSDLQARLAGRALSEPVLTEDEFELF